MKDQTAGVTMLDWGLIKILLQQSVIININMFCWIIIVQGTQWIKFELKTTEQEYMEFKIFHCPVLMAK